MVVAQELVRLGLVFGINGCATIFVAEAEMACGNVVVQQRRWWCAAFLLLAEALVAHGDVVVVWCSRGRGGMQRVVLVCSIGQVRWRRVQCGRHPLRKGEVNESVVVGSGCGQGRDDEDAIIGAGCSQ